jgi:NAD(P)-dependent dehydrogenase (short-subunit alcohol dehydrogenase family)
MKGVLITGAAKRIGAEIARSLAAAGWHVLVHYHSSQAVAEQLRASIEERGGRATLLQADLGNADERARLIQSAFAACPKLEALINNASVFKYDAWDNIAWDNLAHSFEVNAVAPLHLSQQFALALGKDVTGCIINMLDNKIFAPNPDYLSYSTSKFALYGIMQMLARALAPHVRVCGIAPGITLVSGEQAAANFAVAHTLNPLGKGCTPEQIAGAARFILDTPSYNGQVITIDGGEVLAPHGRDVAFLSPN